MKTLRFSIPFVLATAILSLISAGELRAQTSGLFGSNGPIGQQSRSGNTGSSGSSLADGQGGAVDAAAGTSGVNTSFGSGGLVGQSDSAGRLVGRNNAAQGTSQSAQPQFGNLGFGGSNQFNFSNQNNRNFGQQSGRNTGSSRKGIFRPRQKIAFSYAPRAPQEIRTGLTTRFSGIAKRSSQLRDVAVSFSDSGLAILTGEVKSQSAKRLAANLVRLEPGVRSIDNKLTVVP